MSKGFSENAILCIKFDDQVIDPREDFFLGGWH